jgi:hypothetical protein
MNTHIKPQKRWMTSVLKTAAGGMPALPFQRGQRKSLAERMTPIMPRQRMLRSA